MKGNNRQYIINNNALMYFSSDTVLFKQMSNFIFKNNILNVEDFELDSEGIFHI